MKIDSGFAFVKLTNISPLLSPKHTRSVVVLSKIGTVISKSDSIEQLLASVIETEYWPADKLSINGSV